MCIRDRHQTGHIAKRADLLAGLEGPVAGFLIGAAVIGDGNTDMVYGMAQTDRKMMKAEGLNIICLLYTSRCV